MTAEQVATIERLRGVFQFAREPREEIDGSVTLAYLASDNAGFTVRVPTTIRADGDCRMGRFERGGV